MMELSIIKKVLMEKNVTQSALQFNFYLNGLLTYRDAKLSIQISRCFHFLIIYQKDQVIEARQVTSI